MLSNAVLQINNKRKILLLKEYKWNYRYLFRFLSQVNTNPLLVWDHVKNMVANKVNIR